MPCPRSPGELAAERHSKATHPKSHRRLRLRVMLRNPWPRGCCHARRRQNPEVTAQGQAGSREGECFGWARQTSQPTSVRGKDQQVGARPRGLVVGWAETSGLCPQKGSHPSEGRRPHLFPLHGQRLVRKINFF